MKSRTDSRDDNRYNVCLFGVSLDTGNMGVSALAASLIQIIHTARPDAKIYFLISNRSSNPQELESCGRKISVSVVNHRLSPNAHIEEHLFWIFLMAAVQRVIPIDGIRNEIIDSNRFLRTLSRADFVGDIRGGDSFSDIYGLRGFILLSIPRIIALLLKKRLVLLPQTYGPYYSATAKHIARFIIRRSIHVISRDKHGAEVIKRLLGSKSLRKRVAFCPDVAFILEARVPEKLHIRPPITPNLGVPLVGFNVSGLLYNGGYTRNNMFRLKCDYRLFCRELVKRFLQQTPAHVMLLPHTFARYDNVESDPYACRDVLNSIDESHKHRVHSVMREYNQNEIKGIIGLCDFFIGSRMHACIAALSQGIPTVGVAYSRKFKGVFESMRLGSMTLDARLLDTQTILREVLMRFHNTPKSQTYIKKRVLIAKNRVVETFQQILSP